MKFGTGQPLWKEPSGIPVSFGQQDMLAGPCWEPWRHFSRGVVAKSLCSRRHFPTFRRLNSLLFVENPFFIHVPNFLMQTQVSLLQLVLAQSSRRQLPGLAAQDSSAAFLCSFRARLATWPHCESHHAPRLDTITLEDQIFCLFNSQPLLHSGFFYGNKSRGFVHPSTP